MSVHSIFDCIIVGSGPAGYSAAIYTARADLKLILYVGPEPGGQLTTTTEVDNYPGYPQGVSGPQLMEDFKKQAERFGALIKEQTIMSVEFSGKKGGVHKLYTENQEQIQTKGVIIATGASAKYLGLESEERLKGAGVSTCATCDGFFYKGKVVAVIGGGDTALEEAMYLSKLCSKVYLLVRKGQFKASKAMQHRAERISNLEIHFHHEVKEVLGEKFVEAIRVINNQNQQEKTLPVDGLFLAIGHHPNTDVFKRQITLDSSGYIITEKASTKTNIPGVFAAGDVQDSIYRQAITSAGSGCMAALDLERYLLGIN
ncbi:thioredoxin-disulfide reductase [Bacteroidetes bacterium endosymbiont of Geopemphigus sp.]|uniref:thioredoxin-disulfide reductase n=1 Tax=Bacteroidetes bacterium endosymbiont of Geopemphigus sp. TaxID=2047937 RepID=UPI000CCFF672|nr:thioredoxin-disulfide reductase [Bacteroidetes bacterium endosymbiont of Geopemphigus sp.]